ncbi:MAG: hypothetical protein H7A38_06855 [Chlamydiales bacterium]|nr:hypothetical protein [Chlamydiales bacterium]
MSLSQFDGIVYINLDRRTDRKEALTKELKRLKVDFSKVHRLQAVDLPLNGVRGCLLSHIKALDFVKSQGWKRGLILEDDVTCYCSKAKIERETKRFFEKFDGVWDVYLLGGAYFEVYHTYVEQVYRLRIAHRAHAYVVHPEYIPALRDCFQEAVDQTRDHLFLQQSAGFATDAVWEKLQQKDRWFGCKDRLLNQSDGVSDIEGIFKTYRH